MPGGMTPLDLLELLLDLLDDFGGVGAGRLLEHDGGRRKAVDVGVEVVERRAQRDLATSLSRRISPSGFALRMMFSYCSGLS